MGKPQHPFSILKMEEAYSSETLVVPSKQNGATFGNDRNVLTTVKTSNLTSQYPYSCANLLN